METTGLPQLARRMLASASAEEIARLLGEAACRATGARRAATYLWEDETRQFRPASPPGDETLLPEAAVADAAFEEAGPVTVPRAEGGVMSVIPMRSGGRRIGLLVLDVSDSGQIDAERLASVIVLAEHAATALASRRAIEETRGQWALLNNVIESISNGILTIDPDGRLAMMNRNATAMLGLDSAPIGRPAAEVLPSAVAAVVEDLIREIRDRGFSMERRITLQTVGGEALPLSVSVSPLHNPSAQGIAGNIVVLRDMTASQELERLRHVDEMKSQIVANVSHELKTPLTSIKAYTEALMDLVSEEQAKQFLAVINEESDRLLYLINDLLNVSRIQSGRMKLNFEVTDPGALVPEVLRIARVQSEKHSVIVEVEPDLPKMLLDRDKMKEVIVNLLTNAIKYSPDGGRVWIRMKKVEANVQLEVRDEGMGISEEHRAKLFEAFYRVDNSLTYSVSGTGLGLAIVKAIVVAHGGRVWVESEAGRGSAFFALLPVRSEAPRETDGSLRE